MQLNHMGKKEHIFASLNDPPCVRETFTDEKVKFTELS